MAVINISGAFTHRSEVSVPQMVKDKQYDTGAKNGETAKLLVEEMANHGSTDEQTSPRLEDVELQLQQEDSSPLRAPNVKSMTLFGPAQDLSDLSRAQLEKEVLESRERHG